MLKTWFTAATLSRLVMASAELLPLSLMARNSSSGPTIGSSGVLPCDALEAAGLGNRLLSPTDPGYELQIATWFAANTSLRPYCLVLPQTSEEVSTALTALVEANDGAGDWHIAVRSGGHGVEGSSNIANGVTIDLSHMNASSYDPKTNLAKIQPGGRWKNVYADLDKEGVTVTGGRDGGVGVGGFLLGGGNSFFSGRMGFGCDSVVNFEVVLANGTIINANNTTNSDLWQALKGGSSNFGIVTRFDMEAIPSRDLAYDIRYLSSNYSDTVIDAVVEFTNQNQSLADNHLITLYVFNGSASSEISIGCIEVNTQGNLNATTSFNKVKALPALSNATVLESMAKAAEGSQLPSSASGTSTTLLFRNDPQILRGCVEAHADLVETLKRSIDPRMLTTMMLFQPIPTYIGQIGKQRGGNMLGLDAIHTNAILWTAGAAVVPEAGEAALALAQAETFAMTARIEKMLQSLDGDLGFRYLNYAAASQDPLGSYGAANIQHIRDMAAKYDPTEVFQNRIPGGFKISRVA
ncbi:FAD binding domain-containing protein [Hypoxylon cercidicola]|nr:FAD binding domain-containing protein [Hypoxylon cercidicola]